MAPKKPRQQIKGGTSKAAAAHRRELFVAAYISNGQNAADAAIDAGFSPKTARQKGYQLLQDETIRERITQAAKKVAAEAGLSTERWAKEMACIGHFDPAELYHPDGTLIPIRDLPDHVRRAIAGVKLSDYGTEYKIWDKNTALANIGKHLGVFERDNHQKAEGIRVVVQLVG